ncbi:hypothetical protein Y1Q_0002459 [Alligator mississippiensis]|uniref:Uncharacterized protein n=1 Tax=Alligator mississippiensis TaxID=8496 RepID=A0A151NBK5_ALLMI|nr:hypothetical protein Y1Q_0002459 [Alligator mississippiensis]
MGLSLDVCQAGRGGQHAWQLEPSPCSEALERARDNLPDILKLEERKTGSSWQGDDGFCSCELPPECAKFPDQHLGPEPQEALEGEEKPSSRGPRWEHTAWSHLVL